MKSHSPPVNFTKLPNTKAWKLTSLYVRLKANNRCYTCNRYYPLEKLNAGHFREKRGNAGSYFNLENLRAQCFSCNRFGRGMKDIYATKLVKELGPDILEKLAKESNKSKIWTKEELEKIAEHVEQKIKELE